MFLLGVGLNATGTAFSAPPLSHLQKATHGMNGGTEIDRIPRTGQIVRLRSRTWLVENVEESTGTGSVVSLACLDDDAQEQVLDAIWEIELDRDILAEEGWKYIGRKGFDPPRQFAAFLNTLRWNCVTATDPNLFQSPFSLTSLRISKKSCKQAPPDIFRATAWLDRERRPTWAVLQKGAEA